MFRFFVVLYCGLMAAGSPTFAQDSPAALGVQTPSEGPLEITADGSLEWHQEQRAYFAKGNARAVRGNMSVEANMLTAHERDANRSRPQKTQPSSGKGTSALGGDISLLTAEGNVRISDPRQQIFGDRATYDLDERIARITGENLKYVTAHDVITAQDALEYHENQNVALARGKARAVHQDRRIEADVMKAHFAQTPSGQMEMVSMTAEGNVTVVTKNDVTRGNKAIYDIKRNVAVMQGNVRVTRGETQLAGDRAEVDFTKGESRLVNQGSGRVRALLTPKSLDSAPKTGQKTAPETTKSRVKD